MLITNIKDVLKITGEVVDHYQILSSWYDGVIEGNEDDSCLIYNN